METSLIKLVNDILWAMERQEVTDLTALDLSAAFDTVDHEIPIRGVRASISNNKLCTKLV